MNTDSFVYKHNAAETADRLTALWSRKAQDQIFAHIDVKTQTLQSFKDTHTDGETSYPDPHERIAFWDAHFSEMAALEDDSIPSAYLTEFDQGIYAGLLGGSMSFTIDSNTGWISSMAPPILNDLSDAVNLTIDKDSTVLKMMDDQIRIFKETARGKFGIAPFIVIDAMNFVVEVRGATQAFMDVVDSPDEVRRLMEFALDFNIFIQERVHQSVDTFRNGICSALGMWAPGNHVQFSVDAYHLASPGFYYEWGEPYLQRLLDHFAGGLLHIHSNGRHLVEHAVKLKRLICLHLADESWNPRAYNELAHWKEKAGDTPLVVACLVDEFERDFEAGRLPGNVLYKVSGAKSISDANRLMEKVRAYRA